MTGRPSRSWSPWVTALGLAACGSVWRETVVDGARLLEASVNLGPDGSIALPIQVEDGEGRLQLSAWRPDGGLLWTSALVEPSGAVALLAEERWSLDENLTNAVFATPLTTLQWPIGQLTPPLGPGRWTARLAVSTVDVDVDVAVWIGPPPGSGTVTLDVVVLGAMASEAGLRASVQEAVAHAARLWEAAGLTLEPVVREDVALSGELSVPGAPQDGELYAAWSSSRPERAITVVVADALTSGIPILGISGGIPGPLTASSRSAVAVAGLAVAGRDRAFDDEETRLLGETIAHEIGHYMGLYHPFELPSGAEITTWDALDDTPRCATARACEAALADQLMYPTPVCDVGLSSACAAWVPQSVVTEGQAAVARGTMAAKP